MSGYFDSMSGAGYDGTESGGIGEIGQSDNPGVTSAYADTGSGGYVSGLLQATTALGTGYLARRLDIDLAQRQYSAMPYPTLGSTQGRLIIGPSGVPQSGGVNPGARTQPTLLNLNALMPFLMVGGAVFLFARKG